MLRGRFSNMIATANSFAYSDTKKSSDSRQTSQLALSVIHRDCISLSYSIAGMPSYYTATQLSSERDNVVVFVSSSAFICISITPHSPLI